MIPSLGPFFAPTGPIVLPHNILLPYTIFGALHIMSACYMYESGISSFAIAHHKPPYIPIHM